jgi:hypothetical protein
VNKLSFHYCLTINFDQPITDHWFTVKCQPQTDDRQIIENINVKIIPEDGLNESMDSFGNKCIFGHMANEHHLFEVVVTGCVLIRKNAAVKAALPYQLGMYRSHTSHTKPGQKLKTFYKQLNLNHACSNLQKADAIMSALAKVFRYQTASTAIDTTAEAAFSQGKGVCQDYAHIMTAICRMADVPARYVAGMVVGEGLSHAWVEIESNGFWYGFDPTGNKRVEGEHIKISHGRDYTDCLINQGFFTGDTKQYQRISVQVKKWGDLLDEDTDRLSTTAG